MIKTVVAKAFKTSMQFEQPLGKITWLSGPNGSGKTARTQALQLAVQGYVPGFSKKPADIYDNFGGDGKLHVEFVTDSDKRFGRELILKSDGKTTAKYTINGRKTAKDAFTSALASAGNPSVFDLKAFWDLSDAKKIEELANRRGSQALDKIIEKMEEAKTRLNRVRAEIKAKEATLEQLRTAVAQIDLPNMSLAEVTADIKALEAEIQEHRDALKAQAQPAPEPEKQPGQTPPPAEPEVPVFGNGSGVKPPEPADPVQEVTRILETLNAAGCEMCAAKIVTQDVLKKLSGGERMAF